VSPGPGRRELACERVDLAATEAEAEDRLPPPRPRTEGEIWFERHDMVQWLAPRVLLGAATEVVVSGLFARFADKREIEGGLPCEWYDASGLERAGALWVDFASDTGDGFSPTYAVASSLARREIDLGGSPLPRGSVLILGGDEVYPSASWSAYHDRFLGPYSSALPYLSDPREAPYMFALPGNHDWYDGLTSFMRLFAQGGWIGGWRTAQSRSYFALKLAHGWWLWGLDTQFDSYIDAPQLDYFNAVGRNFADGDRVILATAKPSWVHLPADGDADEDPPQSWRTLAFFERRVIEAHGGRLALTLTGDLHHYCHYAEVAAERPQRKITAGGAGAYMSATDPTPAELALPDHEALTSRAGTTRRYRRVAAYPEVAVSRRIARGILWPPIVTHTPSFGVLTGVLYTLLAFCVALGIRDGASSFAEVDAKGVIDLLGDSAGALVFAPLVALLLFAALWGFAAGVEGAVKKLAFALAHWLAHVGVAVGGTLLVLELLGGAGDPPGAFLTELVVAGAGFVLGFVLGPAIFAVYVFTALRIDGHAHANEVYAGQSRGAGSGYKHFLRLRVDRDGVEVFPIAIEGIPREFPSLRTESVVDEEEEWFDSSSLRLVPLPDPEAPFSVR
jgi:hypothetical protein